MNERIWVRTQEDDLLCVSKFRKGMGKEGYYICSNEVILGKYATDEQRDDVYDSIWNDIIQSTPYFEFPVDAGLNYRRKK